MPHDIDAKFRVTMAALGLSSRKELAARFRAVNPRSSCEAETLHKWMQGRALPRHATIYADWAQVLGLRRSGEWISASALHAFIEDVSTATGIGVPSLLRAAATTSARKPVSPAVHGLVGGLASLCGQFICYSRSFSPEFPEHIISGVLRLELGRSGSLLAEYSENTRLGPIKLTGHASLSGRALNIVVVDAVSGVTLFINLHMPGPPVAAICGLLSGPAVVASAPLLCSTPLLAVKLPDTAPDDLSRYFMPTPGAIAADLCAVGISPHDPTAFDARVRAFLAPEPRRVEQKWQVDFAADFFAADGTAS
jgi:hypothetical protein